MQAAIPGFRCGVFVSERRDTTIHPLGDGRVLVDRGGTRRTAWATVDGPRTWVFRDGRTFVVDATARAARRRAGTRPHDDETALSSPMPAVVVAVNVAAGQSVVHGDVLVMLEAMKMELPIRAPRDARVKAIRCRAGELVQPGIPLLELE